MSGVLQILFSLFSMVLLVRYLPQQEYGVWAVVMGLAAPILLFVSFGHAQALYRFMPAVEGGDARRELLWRVVSGRVAIAAGIFALLLAAFPFWSERFGLEGRRELLLWMSPGHVCTAANLYVTAGLNIAFRQREVLIASFVNQSFFVAGVAFGIWRGEEILYFAAVYSGSCVLQLVIGLLAVAYFYGRPKSTDLFRRVSEDAGRRRYRRTTYVDDLGTAFLSADINRLVLAAFAPSAEVAIFAVASSIVERLRRFQPLEIFRPLATVSFFRRFEETGELADVDRMFRLLFAANRVVTVLYLVLFVPLGMPVLGWVFGAEYASSWLPAVFLFAAMGIFAMPIGIVAQALRRPQVLVYAKLAVVVNVGLGIPLAALHGAAGIAFAAMMASLSKNVIAYLLLRREFAIHYPWKSLGRYLVVGASLALGLHVLAGYAGVLVAGVAGGVAWIGALRHAGLLERQDRELLTSLVPDRLAAPARWVLGA